MRFFQKNQSPYQIARKRRRLRACDGCDMVNCLPILRPGEQACCVRCGHILARRHLHPVQRSVALAITALICLFIAVVFPYIGVESGSLHHQIALPQTAETLIYLHQPLVALIIAFNIVVLPAIYLISLITMQAGILRNMPKTYSKWIAKGFSLLHPWMMADVFVVASLVSLVKLVGMADVQLGISFWAYCLFALLLLMTTRSVDIDWLWTALVGDHHPPAYARSGMTAAAQHMVGCPTCGLINQLPECGETSCRRCETTLHIRTRNSLQRTSALLLSALVLYIPANVYPIMITTSLGKDNPSTIVGGMLELWQQGSQPIAAVIFVTSILVPVLKILSLTLLSYVVYKKPEMHAHQRTLLYRITEFIGRWSMVDVFVVAIMVALIQSGNLMSVTPGPAALAFCAVVVVTMLAAMAFDQRLIWDHQGNQDE